jgi:hypothetical protein
MGTFCTGCRIENVVDQSKGAKVPPMLVDTASEYTWVPEARLDEPQGCAFATGSLTGFRPGIGCRQQANTLHPGFISSTPGNRHRETRFPFPFFMGSIRATTEGL